MTHRKIAPDWDRIDESDRYFHLNHQYYKMDSVFTAKAERNRAYHIRHCDYSIRTNPNQTLPYADYYGPIYQAPGRALQTVLTCCNDKCNKRYDRDGIHCHEGFVFHRNVNTLIIYTGKQDSQGNDLYRCAKGCVPVEYCRNCDRRH